MVARTSWLALVLALARATARATATASSPNGPGRVWKCLARKPALLAHTPRVASPRSPARASFFLTWQQGPGHQTGQLLLAPAGSSSAFIIYLHIYSVRIYSIYLEGAERAATGHRTRLVIALRYSQFINCCGSLARPHPAACCLLPAPCCPANKRNCLDLWPERSTEHRVQSAESKVESCLISVGQNEKLFNGNCQFFYSCSQLGVTSSRPRLAEGKAKPKLSQDHRTRSWIIAVRRSRRSWLLERYDSLRKSPIDINLG